MEVTPVMYLCSEIPVKRVKTSSCLRMYEIMHYSIVDLQFGYQCLQSVVDYSTVVKELQTKRMTSNLGPQKCRVLDVLTTLQSSILGFAPFECDMRNQLKKDKYLEYIIAIQECFVF